MRCSLLGRALRGILAELSYTLALILALLAVSLVLWWLAR